MEEDDSLPDVLIVHLQRAEVLFDEKLPEVFRLSLAKSVQNDLFSKVFLFLHKLAKIQA